MRSIFQKLVFFVCFSMLSLALKAHAEPIFYEKYYPSGNGPYPVVIALHTSNGYKTVRKSVKGFLDAGYAVYTPNFFKRHGITHKNRFETWTKYRRQIEAELIEVVQVAKSDKRTNPDNVFAIGFSNGGYWASFLAARNHVNAGASHYGVWSWPKTHNGFPAKYLSKDSNPLLALHGNRETVQRLKWVKPQIKKAANRSSKFKYHIFEGAGHSWDCKPCKKDGFNAMVTQQALNMTLNFFQQSTVD